MSLASFSSVGADRFCTLSIVNQTLHLKIVALFRAMFNSETLVVLKNLYDLRADISHKYYLRNT